jgi:hypothetical protein
VPTAEEEEVVLISYRAFVMGDSLNILSAKLLQQYRPNFITCSGLGILKNQQPYFTVTLSNLC